MGSEFPCARRKRLRNAGVPLGRTRDNVMHEAWACPDCAYVSFDAPEPDFLHRYYQDEYPSAAKSWYNLEYDWGDVRCNWLSQYVSGLASKWIGSDQVRYHESGCAFGGTVHRLNQLGFRASGTDLNANAVAEGRAHGNLAIRACLDREYFAGDPVKADFFYSLHMFEHLSEPVEYLDDIKQILSDNSVALFHVPNAVAYLSLVKGFEANSWFSYPEHLHYFSPGSVTCVARAAGYEVLDFWTKMATGHEAEDAELFGTEPSSAQARLMLQIVEDAGLGRELCFILARSGSASARRHREQIDATRRRSAEFRPRERAYLDILA